MVNNQGNAERANLVKALAKCLHSAFIGHALQFGLDFVQNTCKEPDYSPKVLYVKENRKP